MRARAVAAAAAGLLAVAPLPLGLSPLGLPLPFPAAGRAVAQVATPAAAGDRVGQLVNQNLLEDRNALMTLAGARTQPQQDEAARRLVARQTPLARSYLVQALQSTAPNASWVQLAAAKALADDPTPDAQATMGPLVDLLRVERANEAATAALLNLRTDAAVAAVLAFVSNEPAATSTIKALGMSTDQRVAEKLVELVVQADRNPTNKRNFAADALVEMTGLADNGRNPAAWAAWWRANGAKTRDQFRAELLDRNRRRRPAGLSDVEPLVTELYRLAADKDKPAAIQRVLASADAPFRAAGAKLVSVLFSSGQVPQGAVPRVRELLRDSSPEVRLEAARTLQNLNDKPALDAVLAQLRVEPDAEVRLALMQTLVPMQDARAAPELVRLLDDPSVRTATVAAETLAKIGPAVRADPAQAAATVRALTATLSRRAAQDPTGDLRGACVEAMVPLKDAALLPTLLNLMGDRNQPARVRKAALAAIGELGNQSTAPTVMDVARNNDREPADVRVAALGAMERLADPGFAAALFGLSRQKDVDAQVRRAAAKATEALLPQVDKELLDRWADQLRRDDNPDFAALIPVQAQIVRRAEAAQPPTKPTDLAAVYESLGDAYVQAGRPREGVPHLQRALNVYLGLRQARPAAGVEFDRNITGLRGQVVGAFLAAEQYPEALMFARQAVDAGEAQAEVLQPVGKALDQLIKDRQSDKAQRLATEALKFNRLDPGFQKWFKGSLDAARQAGPGAAPGAGGGGPGGGR